MKIFVTSLRELRRPDTLNTMDAAFAAARDRLGQTLCGKYYVEDVVGVGGTAVVYRASHRNGHKVAVKMLHEYLCKSRDVSRRFMREGYLANILDHPGTVRVLDDDTTEDGIAFLVLEMLEGETLEERRTRLGGVLPLDEVLGYTDQLLSVLQTAHDKNIVHRDIKPSNLFLTNDGVLKVLDFGIARIVNEGSATATKTGTMIGTPAFMPPEQALSKPKEIDAKSDIWSVGATMFTLLSGELVHVAESSSEHLVKAATMQARSVAKVLPGVPQNVESLIARAMSFNKAERWASAREMREALWRVRLDPGRPIGTPSFPAPPRTPLSNFPTFVEGPESSGLAKPAEPLLTEWHGRFGRRTVAAVVLLGALLVVVGATLAAYGTAARKSTAIALEPSPSMETLSNTGRESNTATGAVETTNDATNTELSAGRADAGVKTKVTSSTASATKKEPSVKSAASTKPSAPSASHTPSHAASAVAPKVTSHPKAASSADLYRPF